MSQLIFHLNRALRQIENKLSFMFSHRFPPPENFAVMGFPALEIDYDNKKSNNYSLESLIGNGIFWAVPRNRRTIEKRWKRKYGSPDFVMKLLVPKTNIRVCNSCGHNHEAGVICPHCYKKVIEETKMIQEKIEKELGLNPIEEDVVVLYEGERNEQPSEFWKGKRIVEIERPRPVWFSKNLIQKTTQPPSNTKEIKPNELG